MNLENKSQPESVGEQMGALLAWHAVFANAVRLLHEYNICFAFDMRLGKEDFAALFEHLLAMGWHIRWRDDDRSVFGWCAGLPQGIEVGTVH